MKDLFSNVNFSDFVIQESEESFEEVNNAEYIGYWKQYIYTSKEDD